jgi:glutathione S-transferase
MSLPVLWHLKVSHFNEKARWALDHKQIPHVRRAAVPGRHQAIARRLTGGETFPILELDGQAIGGSAQIIDALERRFPEPPLYQPSSSDRLRARGLEDHFDEELGPHVRLLVLHHMLADGDLLLGAFTPDLQGAQRRAARAAFPLLRRRIRRQFGIDRRSVALAFERVDAAGERFRAEVGPSGYLVGNAFGVADLTLASLLAPAVAPEQFPYPQPQRGHPLLRPVRDRLAAAGLLDWTRTIYACHRSPSAERKEQGDDHASDTGGGGGGRRPGGDERAGARVRHVHVGRDAGRADGAEPQQPGDHEHPLGRSAVVPRHRPARR